MKKEKRIVTIHIGAASRAIIARALTDRVNALHAAAGEVVRVSGGDGKKIAAPLLAEAEDVGAVLDVIRGEESPEEK